MFAYHSKLVGKSQKKSETGITNLKMLLIAVNICSIFSPFLFANANINVFFS